MPVDPKLLEELNDYVDAKGRQYSPFIERGVDQAPARVPMPDADDLRAFGTSDTAELNTVIERYGLSNTPDAMLEQQSKLLERFNATAGTQLYDTQLTTLKEGMEGRVLLAQSRRVSQQYETLVLLDGDLNKLCIYVAEGDDPCDGCAPLAGEEGTAAQLKAEGIWPGEQCYGDGMCQCQIAVFDV